jgi:hypothetical protein
MPGTYHSSLFSFDEPNARADGLQLTTVPLGQIRSTLFSAKVSATMPLKRLFLALLSASACSALPAPSLAASPASLVTSQLPRNARPLHYAIQIQPDAAKLGFDGSVVIDIEILKAGASITLNAAELDIKSARITGGAQAKVSINAAAPRR